MSRKILPITAVFAVLAASLLACGSPPTDDESRGSSAEPLRLASSCAQGQQTNLSYGTGTTLPYDAAWYASGESLDFVGATFVLYGGYDARTGNVDAVVWVRSTDVEDFEYWNDVCGRFPFQPLVSSNPPGISGSKAPIILFPHACITGAQLATAMSYSPYCSN